MDNFFIQENISLQPFTTLKVGGKARYFARIKSEEDLRASAEFASRNDLSVFPLGGGSNVVIRDLVPEMLFLKMENQGIEILKEAEREVYVRVSAGVVWDHFVDYSVSNNFSGIEALSYIPGTVGATPVQNVNAYGAEVGSVIDTIRYFDLTTHDFEVVDSHAADFGYRDSIFKHGLKGTAIIESVVFKLTKSEPVLPRYPLVAETVEKLSLGKDLPLISLIREAIIEIRKEKLPDPDMIPNVGSFFTNPIVDKTHLEMIKAEHADVKYFEAQEGFKIPAGWLIEKAGLKGCEWDGVGTYDKHALVIVNPQLQKGDKVLEFATMIQDNIYSKFGIKLVIEPEIV